MLRRLIHSWPLALLLASATAIAGLDATLPPTPTDFDKLLLMQEIEKEFPAFLRNGNQYGFDPFEVISDQQRLLHELSQDPEYLKAMAERPPLLDLTIQQLGTKTERTTRVDPTQVAEWKSGLRTTLNAHPDPQAALIETLNELKKRSADGILTGIIAKLPPDLKSQAFRQPGSEAKLKFLETSPAVPTEIRAQLEEMKKVANLERRLSSLTALSVVLQREPGHWENTQTAATRLERLSESDLNLFLDYAHFTKPRFERLNQDLEKRQHHTAVKTSVIDAVTTDAKARMTKTVTSEVQVEKNVLKLSELRPIDAIFRGCAAGDCSTKFSFAAPNNPDELVFHVTTDSGSNKGYVEATRVLESGKPILYVSSINGPKISPSDVELILNALYKERSSLGVQQIALPKEGRIDELMNYDSIQKRIKELVKGKPRVPIDHTAPRIRRAIENFDSRYLTMNYDAMSRNDTAILYEPPSDEVLSSIETKIAVKTLNPIHLDRNLDRAKFLAFAAEANESNAGYLDRTLRAFGIVPKEWNEFEQSLKNSEHKPLAIAETASLEKLRQIVRNPNIDLAVLDQITTSSLGKVKRLEARLAAPDAASVLHVKKTVDMIVDLSEKLPNLNSHYDLLESRVQFILSSSSKIIASDAPSEERSRLIKMIIDICHVDRAGGAGVHWASDTLRGVEVPLSIFESTLRGSDPYLKQWAVERISERYRDALPLIEVALKDPAASVRLAAVRALPKYGAAAVPALKIAVTQPGLREHAFNSLFALLKAGEVRTLDVQRIMQPELDKLKNSQNANEQWSYRHNSDRLAKFGCETWFERMSK